MKTIHLTQGYATVVDDDDFERLSAYKWHIKIIGTRRYAVHSYRRGGKTVTIRMHRLILGAESGQSIDHADGDGLNNRRYNLRLATYSENHANRRIIKNKHGFKGVSYLGYTQNNGHRWMRRKPWKAEITAGRTTRIVGYFETRKEAAAAYDAAAKKVFGEFAATNSDLGLR